ncbi:MAG: DsrE family protein [Thermoplasmata archaeon]
MTKILTVIITGKENINRVNVAFNFSIVARKNGNEVEMLFIGPGVQIVNKKHAFSQMFYSSIKNGMDLGIRVKACINSINNEGLTKEDIFEGVEFVGGAVETSERIKEGYIPVTF